MLQTIVLDTVNNVKDWDRKGIYTHMSLIWLILALNQESICYVMRTVMECILDQWYWLLKLKYIVIIEEANSNLINKKTWHKIFG